MGHTLTIDNWEFVMLLVIRVARTDRFWKASKHIVFTDAKSSDICNFFCFYQAYVIFEKFLHAFVGDL